MKREELLKRISIDPTVCFGKPCIRGHRIWVSLILDFLASGWSIAQVLENYPGLEEDDVYACIAYGAEMSRERFVEIGGVQDAGVGGAFGIEKRSIRPADVAIQLQVIIDFTDACKNLDRQALFLEVILQGAQADTGFHFPGFRKMDDELLRVPAGEHVLIRKVVAEYL